MKTTSTTTTSTKTTTKNFTCKYCDKQFKTKSKFNRHVKEIHVDPSKTFQCEFCPKSFKRREHYKRHVKGKHLEQKFECPCCTSKHVEKSRLKTHLLKAHNMSLCFSCGAFHTKDAPKKHVCDQSMLFLPLHLIKHGIVFDCKQCLKCFVSEADKEAHCCLGTLKPLDSMSATTHEETQASQDGLSSPSSYQPLAEAPTTESTPTNRTRATKKYASRTGATKADIFTPLLSKRTLEEPTDLSSVPQKRIKFAGKRQRSFELKPLNLGAPEFADSKSPSPAEEIKFKRFFLEDDVVDFDSIFGTENDDQMNQESDLTAFKTFFGDDENEEIDLMTSRNNSGAKRLNTDVSAFLF